jgi:AcrR family transcriptional regulator
VARIDHPQNARSDRTRTAVLDATWQLIEEQGAEGVTMERVAHRAGTSRRAVYLHFASRGDLLLGLFHHMNERLDLHRAVQPIGDATTPEAALAAWAALVARVHSRILPVARAIDAVRRTDPAAATIWDRAMSGWLAGCRGLAVTLAAGRRLAAPWTVETATDLLWALMGVELIEDLVHDRGWTVEAYEDALRTLAQRTLLGPPGGPDPEAPQAG